MIINSSHLQQNTRIDGLDLMLKGFFITFENYISFNSMSKCHRQ